MNSPSCARHPHKAPLARDDFASPKRGTSAHPCIGYAGNRNRGNLTAVQRLFSMFPPGLPGLALLLLRASVAVALFMDACCRTQTSSGWIQGAAVAIAISLLAGFLTPIVVLFTLAIHLVIWINLGIGSV